MYFDKNLFNEFLKQREVTWLGIDFSRATYTKDGFDLPSDILHYYFNEWNKMFILDQKKYNLRASFQKPIVSYDLKIVTKKNSIGKDKLNIKKHIIIENTIQEENLKEYVTQYNPLPSQTTFSIVFIVESLDHNLKAASVWVVILHNITKNIVLTEKFIERPKGLNTKTYWARAFYNILFKINDLHFTQWTNFIKENPIET